MSNPSLFVYVQIFLYFTSKLFCSAAVLQSQNTVLITVLGKVTLLIWKSNWYFLVNSKCVTLLVTSKSNQITWLALLVLCFSQHCVKPSLTQVFPCFTQVITLSLPHSLLRVNKESGQRGHSPVCTALSQVYTMEIVSHWVQICWKFHLKGVQRIGCMVYFLCWGSRP